MKRLGEGTGGRMGDGCQAGRGELPALSKTSRPWNRMWGLLGLNQGLTLFRFVPIESVALVVSYSRAVLYGCDAVEYV